MAYTPRSGKIWSGTTPYSEADAAGVSGASSGTALTGTPASAAAWCPPASHRNQK